MKTIVLVLGVGVLLTCTGCNRPTDDTTAKKVAALEAKVDTLEKRNSDLALKGRIEQPTVRIAARQFLRERRILAEYL